MTGRQRRRIGRTATAVLMAVVGLAAAPGALATAKNVNFVGTWTPNTGVAWTISGNQLTGSSNDGSANPYTAKRTTR